jgi:hypothetical protein
MFVDVPRRCNIVVSGQKITSADTTKRSVEASARASAAHHQEGVST